MIQVVIWLVMVAGVMVAIWAGVAHVEGIGKAKQLAIDEPQITALAADKKLAIDANASLRGDLKLLGDERQACSDSVVGFEMETAAAKAGKASAQAKAAAAQTLLQEDRDIAVGWALAKRPAGQTCEQTMKIIDDRLRPLAVREYAERPPVDQPKPDVLKVGK